MSLNFSQTIFSAKVGIRFLVLILHYYEYLPQFRSPKEKFAENIPHYPVVRLRSPNSFFQFKWFLQRLLCGTTRWPFSFKSINYIFVKYSFYFYKFKNTKSWMFLVYYYNNNLYNSTSCFNEKYWIQPIIVTAYLNESETIFYLSINELNLWL